MYLLIAPYSCKATELAIRPDDCKHYFTCLEEESALEDNEHYTPLVIESKKILHSK